MKAKIIFFTIFNLIICNFLISQNITNTLGTNGTFTIKDGSTSYLTLSQSTGNTILFRNLELGNMRYSNSTIGVITKNGVGFLHNQGYENTFIGLFSGNFSLSGTGNVGVGDYSLNFLNSGYNNTALGLKSLYRNIIGNDNTAVGYQSLNNNNTGFYNTALGSNSGSTITTGSNLMCLGYNSQPTSGIAINQITLGNNQITSLRCNVQTITSLSDARDKKNISDLSLGLDFISKLKPRQFNWDKREWYNDNSSDGSKMQETPTAGFIAQELDEVQSTQNAEWLNLVLKDNPDKWEAAYGNLLPVMVKAIQELKSENDALKSQIESLKTVEERLAKLELMAKEQNEFREVKLSGK